MNNLFIFGFLEASTWATALNALKDALTQKDRDAILKNYTLVFRALSDYPAEDLATAVAKDLLWHDSALSKAARLYKDIPPTLTTAAQQDLDMILTTLSRDWHAEASRAIGRSLPPLQALAPENQRLAQRELAKALSHADAKWILSYLIGVYKKQGTGILAHFEAFRWRKGHLRGIDYPVTSDMNHLVALETQLQQLNQNTLAFLNHKPCYHTLLYGSRGSGKSTAVRSLLKHFAAGGLRIIELSVKAFQDLPDIIECLRFQPHRYILFVDDLSFEANDYSYQPLKTLLEGSLSKQPDNILVYATSNRRHLVKEHFSDRPDPLNDDVHAWDTQNERLALADRFGLTITFPNTNQERYLKLVAGLLEKEGLSIDQLKERAIRFAEWGNGYSGRTAQHFVSGLVKSK